MASGNLEERLSALESRLQELEDRAAIFQLMATYGPAVDTCNLEAVADLWTEDGIYDTDGYRFIGSADVGSVTRDDLHLQVVAQGAAHMIGMPHLTISGNTAVATGYSQVCLNEGDHHSVWRTSANRWEFLRTGSGWKVTNRINRRLVGSEESRAVLAGAFGKP